jgi:response regulator RpfG family c-di-GMP phosphodiesterase
MIVNLMRHALVELSFYIDEGNLRTRAELLRVMLKTYPLLVISQALLQLLFVALLWEESNHQHLIYWLSCTYLFHLWELIKWRLDREKVETVRDCRQWSRHFTSLSLVIGLLWGAAFMFFFPPTLYLQILLVCLMLALAAGAVTMISIHTPSVYAYLSGIMLPLTFRVMAENDETHWAIASMLLLFLVVIVAAGRELQKMIYLSLDQRFENLSLVTQLTLKKTLLEQANQEIEAANELLRNEGKLLEKLVQERTSELQTKTNEVVSIQDVMIMAMCSLSETRDDETGNHIKRTQNYVRALACQLQRHPRFSDFLTDENIEVLYKVAPLHDIGKVGIPDAILLKPGELTPDEFEIMKTHTTLGGNAIAYSEENFKVRNNNFLRLAQQIATGHHEKWDGSGYPKGLKGHEIPVSARLMAMADVYDALISRRIYKEAFSHERAAKMITEGYGAHFDPDIVDAFLAIQSEFLEIAERYSD